MADQGDEGDEAGACGHLQQARRRPQHQHGQQEREAEPRGATSPKRVSVSTVQTPPCRHTAMTGAP